MKRIEKGLYHGIYNEGEYVIIKYHLLDWHDCLVDEFYLVVGERNNIPFVKEINDFIKEDKSSYRTIKGSERMKGKLGYLEDENIEIGEYVNINNDEMIREIENVMWLGNKKLMMLVGTVIGIRSIVENFDVREKEYVKNMEEIYEVSKVEINDLKFKSKVIDGKLINKRRTFASILNGDKPFFRKKKDWSYLDKEIERELETVA